VNGGEATQGNGSLMRLSPTALMLKTPQAVAEVSDITHASSVVRECAATLADLIRRFVFKSEDVCKDEVRGRYVSADNDGRLVFADRSKVRNGGHAPDTLDSALWAFLSTETFEDALVQAVNNGHDADSVGAVCGQIAGAFYGFSAIPERWVRRVKDFGKVDALVEKFLDYALVGVTAPGYEPTEEEGSLPE
jgi:ADP-ribosyl-[dinitrogen reductase] hydrolase